MRFAIFPSYLSKVVPATIKWSQVIRSASRKIILANVRTLAGNRPDLRTCRMEMSLVLCWPRNNAWDCYKTLAFCSLQNSIYWAFHEKWQLNDVKRQKLVRTWCVCHFDSEMCFAPHPRAFFEQRNFQKCSEPDVFLTFGLQNVLRATAGCTCSAARQKCPGREMLLTFWLRHVLRATAACNLRCLIRPDGSAPAALASLLFDPKKHCFASFLPFRPLILFLPLSRLTFSSLTPLATAASPVHTSEVWLLNYSAMLGAPNHLPSHIEFLYEVRSEKEYMVAWPIWHISLFQD